MVLNGIAIVVVIAAILLLRRHGLLSAMGYPKLFLLSVLLVAVLVILFCGKWSDSLAIDRCLDQGGRWNYETRECDR